MRPEEVLGLVLPSHLLWHHTMIAGGLVKNPLLKWLKKNKSTNISLFNSALYVVAVKGITFFHNFDLLNFKYKVLHTMQIQQKNILTQCFGQLEAT